MQSDDNSVSDQKIQSNTNTIRHKVERAREPQHTCVCVNTLVSELNTTPCIALLDVACITVIAEPLYPWQHFPIMKAVMVKSRHNLLPPSGLCGCYKNKSYHETKRNIMSVCIWESSRTKKRTLGFLQHYNVNQQLPNTIDLPHFLHKPLGKCFLSHQAWKRGFQSMAAWSGSDWVWKRKCTGYWSHLSGH